MTLSLLLISQSSYAALEDLTTYTESDPDSAITVTSTRSTFTNIQSRAHTSYVYKDYGAAHFTDFIHRFTVFVSSASTTSMLVPWMMTNTAAQDFKDAENANVGQVIYLYRDGSNVDYIGIEDEANDNGASWSGFVLNTIYYLEVQRSGTTLSCKIYSDSGYTNIISTISITCNTTSWRYFNCLASENSGASTSIVKSGYSENYDFSATPTVSTGTSNFMQVLE